MVTRTLKYENLYLVHGVRLTWLLLQPVLDDIEKLDGVAVVDGHSIRLYKPDGVADSVKCSFELTVTGDETAVSRFISDFESLPEVTTIREPSWIRSIWNWLTIW